ncbi:RNA-binding protein 48 isoform X2 [Bombina bombina]|nr:RNA-binding protein 48 isoform X2 [Bombina bombina]
MKELIAQFALYGAIEEYNALDEYPAEEFTEVYLIKFQRLQSARVAKRKLDERSFFGGLLHVCYAPEFETVQETREKLQERRKFVAKATSGRERYTTEKKQEPLRNVSQTYKSEFSESGLNSYNRALPLPPSEPLQACVTPVLSRDSNNDSSSSCEHMCREQPKDYVYQPPISSNAQQILQNPRTSVSTQHKQTGPFGSSVRFMPRTTQLQERQRKREQDIVISLCGSGPERQEIEIGPKLPGIPKVDLEDDSLNVSAHFIREKLKEVSSAPASQTSNQTVPPPKQRRRI